MAKKARLDAQNTLVADPEGRGYEVANGAVRSAKSPKADKASAATSHTGPPASAAQRASKATGTVFTTLRHAVTGRWQNHSP